MGKRRRGNGALKTLKNWARINHFVTEKSKGENSKPAGSANGARSAADFDALVANDAATRSEDGKHDEKPREVHNGKPSVERGNPEVEKRVRDDARTETPGGAKPKKWLPAKGSSTDRPKEWCPEPQRGFGK